MNALIVFVRLSNLQALEDGEDVVEVAPADEPPDDAFQLLTRVHFGTCPTCGDRGVHEKEGSGVATWGPCPTCRQSKKLP